MLRLRYRAQDGINNTLFLVAHLAASCYCGPKTAVHCYSFDGVGDLHICQKAKSDDFFKTRPTREDELIKALPACINYLSDKKAVANLLIKAGYRKTHASDNALLRRISNHLLPQLSEQDGMMVALKSLAERLK